MITGFLNKVESKSKEKLPLYLLQWRFKSQGCEVNSLTQELEKIDFFLNEKQFKEKLLQTKFSMIKNENDSKLHQLTDLVLAFQSRIKI